MRIEDLSVNERILVHLKDFGTDPEAEGARLGQTQEGIGEAVGIRINHVPRATNALLKDGYIGEALVHIGGLKRKRKAFFLTPAGAEMASRILAKVKFQKIAFRSSKGEEGAAPVQDLAFRFRGSTPSQLILAFFRDGVVLEASVSEGARPYASNLDAVPAPEAFVGRAQETRFIRDRLGSGSNLLTVSGMKGIGKTSLVLAALKEFEGRKNIFWYSLHDWDTPRSLLDQISERYVRLGRNEAKKALRQNKDIEIGQGASALLRDMKDSDSILVLDNVFGLKRETMQLVYTLAEQCRELGNSALIIITRDRESIEAAQCIREGGSDDLVVRGLEHDSAMELMKSMGMTPEDSDRVFAMTQGHPLAIKLVNSEEIGKVIDTKGLTNEEIWVVRCMKAFDAIFNE